MKQLVLDLIPSPLPSFDNFVPGRHREALKALQDAAFRASTGAARGNAVKVIYLWGPPGCGKSHLARSLALVANVQALSIQSLAATTGDGYYVFDDVADLPDHAQIGLFNLINDINAADARGWVLATGPVAPRDLPLRPELSSRLGSGLSFQLLPLSDDEKAAALQAHAESRGFNLREGVITYLLRHARRDMGSLIGILDALDQYSLQTGREVTLPLLREMGLFQSEVP